MNTNTNTIRDINFLNSSNNMNYTLLPVHSATITMRYLDPPGRPQTQWQMLTGYHRNHNS